MYKKEILNTGRTLCRRDYEAYLFAQSLSGWVLAMKDMIVKTVIRSCEAYAYHLFKSETVSHAV